MKHVLVTGASRGIGRAIALSLASRGARVALHFNSDEAGAEQTRLAMAGSGHAIFGADLSDADAIEPLWRRVMVGFGSIDAVVNNAGIYVEHSPLTSDYEDWKGIVQHTFATNCIGPAQL